MKNFPVLTCLLACFSVLCAAQGITFKTTYGSNNDMEGRSVAVLSNGNYLLCGSNGGFNAGSSDMLLIKTHSNGLKYWSKNFGGGQSETGISVFEDTLHQRYILSGTANTADSSYQAYIVCTDTSGNLLWQKFHGGEGWDGLNGSIQQDALHYLFWGYTSDSAGMHPIVFQTDTAGNTTWRKIFDNTLISEINSVCIHPGNELFFGGSRQVNDTVSNMVIGKLTATGSQLWMKAFASSFDEKASQVAISQIGRLLVLGYSKNAPAGNENFYLRICNGAGDVLSVSDPGSVDHETGTGLAVSMDGFIGMCGQTAGPGYEQIYFFKIDSLCNYQASTTYLAPLATAPAGLYHAYAYQMRATADSGFVIAGTLYNTQLLKGEPYLIKTDAAGNTSTGLVNTLPAKNTTLPYPNPARDIVYLPVSPEKITSIRALAMTGQAFVMPLQQGTISVAEMQAGCYTLVICRKDSHHEYYKLVVTK